MPFASDAFEDWWEKQPPLSDQEKTEIMMTYLDRILVTMDEQGLSDFRENCLARFLDTRVREEVLNLIQGQLSLLRLSQGE